MHATLSEGTCVRPAAPCFPRGQPTASTHATVAERDLRRACTPVLPKRSTNRSKESLQAAALAADRRDLRRASTLLPKRSTNRHPEACRGEWDLRQASITVPPEKSTIRNQMRRPPAVAVIARRDLRRADTDVPPKRSTFKCQAMARSGRDLRRARTNAAPEKSTNRCNVWLHAAAPSIEHGQARVLNMFLKRTTQRYDNMLLKGSRGTQGCSGNARSRILPRAVSSTGQVGLCDQLSGGWPRESQAARAMGGRAPFSSRVRDASESHPAHHGTRS